jgi:hypothetical protein
MITSVLSLDQTKTPCLRKVFMLGGGGEIRTPAPDLSGLTI